MKKIIALLMLYSTICFGNVHLVNIDCRSTVLNKRGLLLNAYQLDVENHFKIELKDIPDLPKELKKDDIVVVKFNNLTTPRKYRFGVGHKDEIQIISVDTAAHDGLIDPSEDIKCQNNEIIITTRKHKKYSNYFEKFYVVAKFKVKKNCKTGMYGYKRSDEVGATSARRASKTGQVAGTGLVAAGAVVTAACLIQ